MKARPATAAILLTLTLPAPGLAQDNPWKMIKGLLREPVSELKQQLEQIRPPGKVQRPTTRPEVAVEPEVTVPRPVARPSRDAPSGSEPAASNQVAVSAAAPAAGARPGPSPDVAVAARPETATAATESEASGSPDMTGAIPRQPAKEPPGVAAPATDTPAQLTPGRITAVRAVEALTDAGGMPAASTDPALQATPPAPIPRPRPEAVIAYAARETTVPPTGSAAAIGSLIRPLPPLDKPPPAARSTCGVALARLGVEAKPITPIREGACGIAEPVAVAALGDGVTDLTTRAIVRCQLAEVVANWLGDDVQPAARRHLGGDVVGLRVAASYTCRSRNNVSGAKLSEHGRGNAIDISAFKVAERGWIAVGGSHSVAESRFLSAIRKAACGPFTTVLGPGSDAHHSDHFHFDLAKRSRRGKSRGLYCQ